MVSECSNVNHHTDTHFQNPTFCHIGDGPKIWRFILENVTLRKKLSTYVSDAGRIKNASDELLFDLLKAWEEWPGTAKDFYRSIGFSHRQMAKLIGKAKKLQREGYFGNPDFKEIQLEPSSSAAAVPQTSWIGAEIVWDGGRVIRFSQVDLLLEFLKKAA